MCCVAPKSRSQCRISRTVFSALSGLRLLASLIFAAQWSYYEPEILSYPIIPFCPTSADGLQCLSSDDLGLMAALFIAAADRCDDDVASNAEVREVGADGVSNIARREMCVVLFRHARVRVAELRGDDAGASDIGRSDRG
jgi:hypothetical protein